jgi:long-chain acyl-CoA synthetase
MSSHAILDPVAVSGSAWAGDSVTYRGGEKARHEVLFDHAADVSGQTATIYYGTQLTWRQTADAVRRLAAFLRQRGTRRPGTACARSTNSLLDYTSTPIGPETGS